MSAVPPCALPGNVPVRALTCERARRLGGNWWGSRALEQRGRATSVVSSAQSAALGGLMHPSVCSEKWDLRLTVVWPAVGRFPVTVTLGWLPAPALPAVCTCTLPPGEPAGSRGGVELSAGGLPLGTLSSGGAVNSDLSGSLMGPVVSSCGLK